VPGNAPRLTQAGSTETAGPAALLECADILMCTGLVRAWCGLIAGPKQRAENIHFYFNKITPIVSAPVAAGTAFA